MRGSKLTISDEQPSERRHSATFELLNDKIIIDLEQEQPENFEVQIEDDICMSQIDEEQQQEWPPNSDDSPPCVLVDVQQEEDGNEASRRRRMLREAVKAVNETCLDGYRSKNLIHNENYLILLLFQSSTLTSNDFCLFFSVNAADITNSNKSFKRQTEPSDLTNCDRDATHKSRQPEVILNDRSPSNKDLLKKFRQKKKVFGSVGVAALEWMHARPEVSQKIHGECLNCVSHKLLQFSLLE